MRSGAQVHRAPAEVSVMGLQTLKPRLSTLKANRTQVLEAKAFVSMAAAWN